MTTIHTPANWLDMTFPDARDDFEPYGMGDVEATVEINGEARRLSFGADGATAAAVFLARHPRGEVIREAKGILYINWKTGAFRVGVSRDVTCGEQAAHSLYLTVPIGFVGTRVKTAADRRAERLAEKQEKLAAKRAKEQAERDAWKAEQAAAARRGYFTAPLIVNGFRMDCLAQFETERMAIAYCRRNGIDRAQIGHTGPRA